MTRRLAGTVKLQTTNRGRAAHYTKGAHSTKKKDELSKIRTDEVWFIQIKLGRTVKTTGLFEPGVDVKKEERQMHKKPLERNG